MGKHKCKEEYESNDHCTINPGELTGPGIFTPDNPEKPKTALFVVERLKKDYKTKWLSVWQNVSTGVSIMEQAKYDKPLTQTEYRVRDMIIGLIGYNNWALINQAEIAREIRVDTSNVNKALCHLIALGIIERGDKFGRYSQYKVSSGMCFKGTLDEGQRLVKQAEKQHARVIRFPSQNVSNQSHVAKGQPS